MFLCAISSSSLLFKKLKNGVFSTRSADLNTIYALDVETREENNQPIRLRYHLQNLKPIPVYVQIFRFYID